MSALLLAFLAAAAAAQNPFAPQADDQRRAAQGLEPAALEPPGLGGTHPTVAVRIRFYADSDYRAALFRWAERTRAQLTFINQFVEPGFGVRFEAESFRRWHRQSSSNDVREILGELEALDNGQGVDWVVGFVTALPLVSSSMHELGAARVLGRHFVLRGMASTEDAQAIGRSFELLAPAERDGLYSRRKWHKEAAVFLHEWLHTLGAMHSADPQNLMNPSYAHRMRGLAPEDAQLAVIALQARLRARAAPAPDWSALRGFVERTTAANWVAKEREELLAALVKTGARAGVGPAAKEESQGLPAEDSERLSRAVELLKARKEAEAWSVASVLGSKHPGNLDAQRLLCRLGHVAAARDQGEAACKRARALAPEDPVPLLDAAQAYILRKQNARALALIDEAAGLAGKLPRERATVWTSIGRLYGQIGAFSRAEETARRADAASAPDLPALREALARDRATLGLPPAGGKPGLDAERELAYAERHRRLVDLLSAGKLREARAGVVEALREFPGTPGLEVLACEVDLRQGRTRQAEKACERALAAVEGLPRAHYLLAHTRLGTGKRDAAVASLRRAIEIEPEQAAPWETLADVYRAAGRRQELARLKADYETRFSKPLK